METITSDQKCLSNLCSMRALHTSQRPPSLGILVISVGFDFECTYWRYIAHLMGGNYIALLLVGYTTEPPVI